MCDDFGSDSGSFDDVGSSDFDSDVSSDFDTDFSSDIDSMDFDDVETIDFDDDFSSDFDTSDSSDDFESMEFDDVETIDFDDDISDDFNSEIETMDVDDDIESLDFDDDIETLEIEDDIETLDFDDEIETLDIDDIETLDFDDKIETLDIDDEIEMLDIEDDIETLDLEDDVEVSDLSEDIEDMNIEDISEESLEIEEGFDDSDMEIFDDEAEFEAEIAEMDELTEAMEAENSDFDIDTESMDFDDAEAIDMADEFEDIEADDSDEISEDFDFDNEIEDIDISEDVEAMDLDEEVASDDVIETTDDIDDGSFDSLEEATIDSDDALEEALTELEDNSHDIPVSTTDGGPNGPWEDILTEYETEISDPGDIPTYVDADETTETPEAIDWDSMLSDGDRDYIDGIMNNDNYTPEQKDYLVREALGEIYERETAEPEYGARVRALTYDGHDIITKPPEDYECDITIDEGLLDDALNNENLSAENLGNIRDYIENIANDESLTNDEKTFLINEALGFTANMTGTSQEAYDIPSSFEAVNDANAPEEVAESLTDAPVNEYNEPFSGELSEQDIDTVYEGLNEYDFHGVDCFEDTERLDASLENFTAENWENLSLQEQKDQMTDLAQYIIDVTGLENPPKIEFYNSGKDGDYGGFNRATNTLSINEHMLYQNDEAADTVAHELWHAYQYERASNPSTKLDHMYLANFDDYITPDDDFEGYQSQILESEARAFAQQIKDRLHSY